MDRPEVNPTALPPGTQVGSWRVTGFRGRGVYGAVYRAVRQGHSRSGPVALKLAIYPADPRFEREVELLSRIRHPSVPRLLDAGRWSDDLGRVHPFLVMRRRGAGNPEREPSEWTEAERAEAAELGHRACRRDRKRATGAERADAAMRAEQAQREVRLRARHAAPTQQPRGWLLVLAAVLTLGLWPEQTGWVRTGVAPTMARSEAATEQDAVSLAEDARSSSSAPEKPPAQGVVGMELPKKPRPGQLRPDANGRCPAKKIVLNGGCWIKVDLTPEECVVNGFTHQGDCYLPVYAPSGGPTSAPQEK